MNNNIKEHVQIWFLGQFGGEGKQCGELEAKADFGKGCFYSFQDEEILDQTMFVGLKRREHVEEKSKMRKPESYKTDPMAQVSFQVGKDTSYSEKMVADIDEFLQIKKKILRGQGGEELRELKYDKLNFL